MAGLMSANREIGRGAIDTLSRLDTIDQQRINQNKMLDEQAGQARTSTVTSAAGSGMAAGALIGSSWGLVGTVIGGIIGGIVGGGAAYGGTE